MGNRKFTNYVIVSIIFIILLIPVSSFAEIDPELIDYPNAPDQENPDEPEVNANSFAGGEILKIIQVLCDLSNNADSDGIKNLLLDKCNNISTFLINGKIRLKEMDETGKNPSPGGDIFINPILFTSPRSGGIDLSQGSTHASLLMGLMRTIIHEKIHSEEHDGWERAISWRDHNVFGNHSHVESHAWNTTIHFLDIVIIEQKKKCSDFIPTGTQDEVRNCFAILKGFLDSKLVYIDSYHQANHGPTLDTATVNGLKKIRDDVQIISTTFTITDDTIPSLTTVSITSNNADTTQAVAGDVVTLTFTADQTVQSVTTTIDGNTAAVTNTSGNSYTVTRTMLAGDTEGTILFTIDFENTNAVAGTQVTSTTDGSSVTFTETTTSTTTQVNVTTSVLDDPNGHELFIALGTAFSIALTIDIDSSATPGTVIAITLSAPIASDNFIPVSGTIDDQNNVVASGIGTAAGFSNVSADYTGVFDPVNNIVTSGVYILGANGALPPFVPITSQIKYNFVMSVIQTPSSLTNEETREQALAVLDDLSSTEVLMLDLLTVIINSSLVDLESSSQNTKSDVFDIVLISNPDLTKPVKIHTFAEITESLPYIATADFLLTFEESGNVSIQDYDASTQTFDFEVNFSGIDLILISVNSPVITSPIDGDTIITDTVTLTGTSEANTTIQVFDGTTSLGNATADSNGDWTFTTEILADGSHTFTATATIGQNISAASNVVNITSDAGTISCSATLSGSNEVPPVSSSASGTTTLQLNAAQTRLTISTSLSGLDLDGLQTSADSNDDVAGAHIHREAVGVDGPIIFGMINPDDDLNGDLTIDPVAGTIFSGWDSNEGSVTTLTAEVTNLLNDGLYVNIHTSAFPGGEIRGQILCQTIPSVIVSGTVFSDDNDNNTQDGTELGISGVTIVLVDGDGVLSSTTTSSSGAFSFSNVAPGGLLVQVAPVPANFLPATGQASFVRPTLESGGTVTANFALVPITSETDATVTGTVYNDANDNNVLDSGETGIEGITVFVVDFLTLQQTTVTTDSNGVYTAEGVLPDNVLVQIGILPAGTLASTGSDTFEFPTLGLGSTTTINFGVRTLTASDKGTIIIEVFNDANANGVKDSGEVGVPNATVFTFELLTAISDVQFTDSNGISTHTGLIPDVVLASINAVVLPEGFTTITTTNTIPGAEFITVTPGSTTTVQIGLN